MCGCIAVVDDDSGGGGLYADANFSMGFGAEKSKL